MHIIGQRAALGDTAQARTEPRLQPIPSQFLGFFPSNPAQPNARPQPLHRWLCTRRTQLKALVDIHGVDEGLGGNLTEDEVQVICGALDLTAKTARK